MSALRFFTSEGTGSADWTIPQSAAGTERTSPVQNGRGRRLVVENQVEDAVAEREDWGFPFPWGFWRSEDVFLPSLEHFLGSSGKETFKSSRFAQCEHVCHIPPAVLRVAPATLMQSNFLICFHELRKKREVFLQISIEVSRFFSARTPNVLKSYYTGTSHKASDVSSFSQPFGVKSGNGPRQRSRRKQHAKRLNT